MSHEFELKEGLDFAEKCLRMFEWRRMTMSGISDRFEEPTGILNKTDIGSADSELRYGLLFEPKSIYHRSRDKLIKTLVFIEYSKKRKQYEISFFKNEHKVMVIDSMAYILLMLRQSNFLNWYQHWGYDDEYFVIPFIKALRKYEFKNLSDDSFKSAQKKNEKYLKKLLALADRLEEKARFERM